MAAIERLAAEGIANVTAEKWQSCIEHVVKKVKEHYWADDGITEEAVKQVVIQLRGVDESSERK